MDLVLSALLASTALLQDKHPSRQAVLAHALLDTRHQEQARRLSRIATYVMLAMEAHQLRILDLPLAVVPFAQLARIKQLQAISRAQLALLDTQPLQQEVLLSRLALSALLAIMAHHRLQIRAVLYSLLIYALPASLRKLEPHLILLIVHAATVR